MLLKMKVSGLTIDPFTNVPIVILKDMEEKNTLPVWIGVLEASAIASELEKIQFSRPMTHDLLREILKSLGAAIEKVEIVDLRDNVYYALIQMTTKDGGFTIDSPRGTRQMQTFKKLPTNSPIKPSNKSGIPNTFFDPVRFFYQNYTLYWNI